MAFKPPRILVYDGTSTAPLGEWTGLSSVSVAFSDSAPDTAEIVLPRNGTHLLASSIMPSGTGVYVEIDSRDLGTDEYSATVGTPDVWWGRVQQVSASSRGATCSVSCGGPSSWLDGITVAMQRGSTEPAVAIARRILDQYPRARLTLGPIRHEGASIPTDFGGQSLQAVLDALAETRGEEYAIDAVVGECRGIVSWRTPLAARDRTADIVLAEGVNCEWDTAYQLDTATSELAGIASSLIAGQKVVGASVTAPAGPMVGRHAALTAVLASPIARDTVDGTQTVVRPDIPTRDELAYMLDVELRRTLVPPIMLQVTLTDPSLWASIRSGDLVRTQIDDPLGLFTDAVGRVLDRSYSLTPPLSATMTVELWSVT